MNIHITKHGQKTKMNGIKSINTSSKKNPYCVSCSQLPKSICSKCYGIRLETIRTSLEHRLEQNYNNLTTSIIQTKYLPVFQPSEIIRLHSFGELANECHLQNFINICKVNKASNFILFTKRTELVNKVIKVKKDKPKNLKLIISSFYLNDETETIPEFFDLRFTVTTQNEKINCNAKDCIACKKCYNPDFKNIIIFAKPH